MPDRIFPIIGLTDDIEPRCGGRIPNFPELNFETEETNRLVSKLVQPIKSGTMIFAELSRNPDNRARF